MRTEAEVNSALERYSDMVRRLCTVYLKNQADAEDIFQTVFLKYALSTKPFESAEHEKAWQHLLEIDPGITAEEVAQLTKEEIRQLARLKTLDNPCGE